MKTWHKLTIISVLFIIILFTFTLTMLKKNDSKITLGRNPESKKGFNLTDANDHKKGKTKFDKFKGLDIDKDNIKLSLEGKNLDLDLPIYIDHNRYYIPLTEIVDKLEGSITVDPAEIKFNLKNTSLTINIAGNTFIKDGQVDKLKKNPIIVDGVVYISVFDFTRMLNLTTNWDYKNKNIALFNNREKINPKQVSTPPDKIALVRLEDIAASQTFRYGNADSLRKLRIIADYLYSQNIPFHVAWVPKYVDFRPQSRDDDDLTRQNNMYNADFLFTLDYFTDRNGMIGLHGYTHQYGNEPSVDGYEFATPRSKIPASDEYAQERINMAKEEAKILDVPYGFFEAPHYGASPNQLKVMENNFSLLYQPYISGGIKGAKYITIRKNGGKISKYIPTPLDYVDGKKDTDNMIKKINNLTPDLMASFFYHPNIEFDDINLTNEADGYPSYSYSEDSPLHKIVKTIEEKGYRFQSISSLK